MIIKRMKKLVVLLLLFFLAVRPVGAAEYALPYPGILPDSPVYFLKNLRDQTMLFFLRSKTQRSFYLLLMSDKRLGAGQVLVNTGKTSLGVTTLAKSQDYFKQAVNLADKNNRDLLSKLVVAGSKHQEVLGNLRSKAPVEKVFLDNQKDFNRVTEMLMTP